MSTLVEAPVEMIERVNGQPGRVRSERFTAKCEEREGSCATRS